MEWPISRQSQVDRKVPTRRQVFRRSMPSRPVRRCSPTCRGRLERVVSRTLPRKGVILGVTRIGVHASPPSSEISAADDSSNTRPMAIPSPSRRVSKPPTSSSARASARVRRSQGRSVPGLANPGPLHPARQTSEARSHAVTASSPPSEPGTTFRLRIFESPPCVSSRNGRRSDRIRLSRSDPDADGQGTMA